MRHLIPSKLVRVVRSFVGFSVLGLVLPTLALAAPDLFRYNGGRSDRAGGVATDAAGNWHVAASVERTDGGSSFAVIKHRPDGSVAWVSRYNGASGGTGGAAVAVAVDSAGNVYASGYVYFGGTSLSAIDGLVVKFDAAGVQRWSYRYAGPGNYYDLVGHLAIDGGGNLYASGRSYGTSFDFVTLKFSSTGSVLWSRIFDGPANNSDDEVVDLELDPAGQAVVMGRIGNVSGAFGDDVMTIKYDAAGQVLWQAVFTFTNLSDEAPSDMDVDLAGNVAITGQTAATSSPEQEIVAFLAKYGPDGQLVFGFKDANAGGSAVASDTQGHLYVTGSSSPVFAANYSAVSKFDAAGSLVWTTPIPATATTDTVVYRLAIDPVGVASLAGVAFDRSTLNRDFFTMRLAASGSVAWQHRWNGTGDRNDEVTGLALDLGGNLVVVGTSWSGYVSSGGTAEDVITLRFPAGTAPAPAQKPAAPSNLTVTSTAATRVALRWTDRSSDESGFRIERCTGSGCTAFTQVGTVLAGTVTFTDSAATRSTKYTYRVLAFNDAGLSGPSNVVSVTTSKK